MGGKGTVMQKIIADNEQNRRRLQTELAHKYRLKRMSPTEPSHKLVINPNDSTPPS